MKRTLLAVGMLGLLVGCAADNTDRFKNLIKDPHYAAYQQKQDDLERKYLQGKIDYPRYQEQKKQFEDTYSKEVKEREEKLHQD